MEIDEPIDADPRKQAFDLYSNFFKSPGRLNDCRRVYKDPYFDFCYTATSPCYVLKTPSYELVKAIQISFDASTFTCDPMRVLAFPYRKNEIYVLYYTFNSLLIYPLTGKKEEDTDTSKFTKLKMSYLRDNESIVNVNYLKNELDIPYFLVITTLSRIFLIKIAHNLQINDFAFISTELMEKVSIFSKFIGNFTSINNIYSAFILNPFSYSQLLKNNKKGNVIFILNEKYLKKLEFNVTTKGIEPDVAFQINMDSLIQENLKDSFGSSANSFSMTSADICYDHVKKLFVIYFILKITISTGMLKETYVLYRLHYKERNEIELKTYMNLTNQFKDEEMKDDDGIPQNVTLSEIIVNKYIEEGYIICSLMSSSHLFYFSSDNPLQFFYQNAMFEIAGLCPFISPDGFSIDSFSFSKGLWNFCFKNGNFIFADRTDIIISNAISPKNLTDDNENNKCELMLHYTNTKPQSNLSSQIQATYDIIKRQVSEFAKKVNEKYYQAASHQKITEEISTFLQKLQREDKETIYMALSELMNRIIDDDTLNIEILNKGSTKAELVIVEYLIQKENSLEIIFDFMKFYQLFHNFDQKNHIFSDYLANKEKLSFCINMREFENKALEKRLSLLTDKLPSFSKKINERLNEIALDFFEKVYSKIKNQWKTNLNIPFSKHLVFSKISEIDTSYLSHFFNTYGEFIESNKISQDDKIILSFFLMTLFNGIISSIRQIHLKCQEVNEYQEPLGENEIYFLCEKIKDSQDTFWFLTVSNLNFLKGINEKFIGYYSKGKEGLLANPGNEMLIYVDNLLYLYEVYFLINSSSQNSKFHFEIKKNLIKDVVQYDPKKSLSIAIKYKDYYSITYICYRHQLFNDLKSVMKGYKDNRNIIIYFLKLFLLFESNNVNQPSPNFQFSFFDIFADYAEEISIITQQFPKLKFYHDLFFKHLNRESFQETNLKIENLIASIDDDDNIEVFLKISKILNSLNKCNFEEALFIKQLPVDQVDQNFLEENEFIAKEINFCILVNYLRKSYGIKIDHGKTIFASFEDFIYQYISANVNPQMKYIIAIQLVQLASTLVLKFPDGRMLSELLSVRIFD